MSAPSSDSTRDFITALRWLADHPGDLAWRRRACEAMRTAADAIEAAQSSVAGPRGLTVMGSCEPPFLNIDGVELAPGIMGIGKARAVDLTGDHFAGVAITAGERVTVSFKRNGTRLEWQVPGEPHEGALR